MPVKSTPVSTPTTPRKRRARKTSTKSARVEKVIKEVQAVLDTPKAKPAKAKKSVSPRVTVTTFKGGKVVAKQITLKRPSTARLITPQRYFADIQTRWAIHNFEIQELISDFIKGFEAVKPYHAQFVKMVNK